jgi:hypothetical protein
MFKQNSKPEERALKAAYEAGQKAIFNSLGKDTSHENFYDTVVLLAASVISGNGHLTKDEAQHNCVCFVGDLMRLLEEAPLKKPATSITSRLM